MNKFHIKFFVLDTSQFNLLVNSNSNKNFNNNNNTKNFNKNLKNNNNRNINGKFPYYIVRFKQQKYQQRQIFIRFHTTQYDLNYIYICFRLRSITKFSVIKFSIKFSSIINFKFPYYIVIIKFPSINYIKINNVIGVRQLQKSEARA